jgi:hypothetical protein
MIFFPNATEKKVGKDIKFIYAIILPQKNIFGSLF